MSILIKGLDMPAEGEILYIDIYPDGKVAHDFDLMCTQIATAVPGPLPGKWKKAYADHEAIGERPFFYYCSRCCTVTVFKSKYCPHCGAKMED